MNPPCTGDDTFSAGRDQPPRGLRYCPLMIVCAAVCAGIVFDRLLALSCTVWSLLLVLAAIAWWDARRHGRLRTASWLLLIAVAACAGLRHHLAWQYTSRRHIARHATPEGQPLCVEGIVVDGPSRIPAPAFDPMRIIPGQDGTAMEIRAVRVRVAGTWRPADGRLPVWIRGHALGIHAADRIRLLGRLSTIEPPGNPGAFRRCDTARADGVLAALNVASPDAVERLRPGAWADPARWLGRIRERGHQLLWRHLSRENAPLANAMLLGERQEISNEQFEAFRLTGTAHVLAISGLHVGLLAAGLLVLARVCFLSPRRTALLLASLIVAYAVLAGSRPPVLRATILILVYAMSLYTGRRASSLNALAAAAILVLGWNPNDLFRIGPQLSFLAVAAVLWFGPMRIPGGWKAEIDPATPRAKKQNRFAFWSQVRQVAVCEGLMLGRWFLLSTLQIVRVTLIIWLVTLPLTMYYFHVITPVGLVLNAVLWLPLSAALASGFFVLLIGWLAPPVAIVPARLCDAAFDVIRCLIDLSEAVPGGHVFVPGTPLWWVVGFYVVLVLWAIAPPPWRSAKRVVGSIATWAALGLAATLILQAARPSELAVTVLSVGHGQAIVVQLPDGRAILCDAGRMGSPRTAERTVCDALWSLGITRLEAIIISHADADHFNAVPGLVERIPIGAVYVSPQTLVSQGAAACILREKVESAGIPIRTLAVGDVLVPEEADAARAEGPANSSYAICVLHPPKSGNFDEDNAASIALRVEHRGHAILLLGDLEPPGLWQVLAQEAGPCDVLVAPHHGSLASDPAGVCDWCRPTYVVISGGVQDYRPAVLDAYSAGAPHVFHTWHDGAISCRASESGVRVEPCRPP